MERQQLLSELFENFGIMRRLMHASQPTASDRKGALTSAQFALLTVITQDAQPSIKGIAQHFGMTSSAITQMVNSLVRDQLLTRTVDKADRRKVQLMLTASGRRALERTKTAHCEKLLQVFSCLTDTELKQLHRIQSKLMGNLAHV